MKEKLAIAILTLAVFVAGFLVHSTPKAKFGGFAAAGPATVATTTRFALVAATAAAIEATSSCAARIITTYASPIMLTFDATSGQLPTGVFGFLQPASTTVAYDAGLYGCGLVTAYSFTAQTITVSDAR